jgi:cytochrome b561
MASAHSFGSWALVALIVLHVLAALKHQYIDKDGLLTRMLPFIKG